jgi:hypothetical protein
MASTRYLKKPAGTYQRYRLMLTNAMEQEHVFGHANGSKFLSASPNA